MVEQVHFKKKNNLSFDKLSFSKSFFLFFVLISILFLLFPSVFSAPIPPNQLGIVANETAPTPSAAFINISGGRLATLNITSRTQNPRWKAFVGNVTGSFALDDATGATIYDWSLTTLTGEIYATRNSSSISWTNVNCTNVTTLTAEDVKMSHTSADDNITRTFNRGINGSHAAFAIGAITIPANTCPTLNTYVGNATQDVRFEEMALYESTGSNIIYNTILENDVVGFDSQFYDFQMIVPEVGTIGNTISTAYYLYVEIT